MFSKKLIVYLSLSSLSLSACNGGGSSFGGSGYQSSKLHGVNNNLLQQSQFDTPQYKLAASDFNGRYIVFNGGMLQLDANGSLNLYESAGIQINNKLSFQEIIKTPSLFKFSLLSSELMVKNVFLDKEVYLISQNGEVFIFDGLSKKLKIIANNIADIYGVESASINITSKKAVIVYGLIVNNHDFKLIDLSKNIPQPEISMSLIDSTNPTELARVTEREGFLFPSESNNIKVVIAESGVRINEDGEEKLGAAIKVYDCSPLKCTPNTLVEFKDSEFVTTRQPNIGYQNIFKEYAKYKGISADGMVSNEIPTIKVNIDRLDWAKVLLITGIGAGGVGLVRAGHWVLENKLNKKLKAINQAPPENFFSDYELSRNNLQEIIRAKNLKTIGDLKSVTHADGVNQKLNNFNRTVCTDITLHGLGLKHEDFYNLLNFDKLKKDMLLNDFFKGTDEQIEAYKNRIKVPVGSTAFGLLMGGATALSGMAVYSGVYEGKYFNRTLTVTANSCVNGECVPAKEVSTDNDLNDGVIVNMKYTIPENNKTYVLYLYQRPSCDGLGIDNSKLPLVKPINTNGYDNKELPVVSGQTGLICGLNTNNQNTVFDLVEKI